MCLQQLSGFDHDAYGQKQSRLMRELPGMLYQEGNVFKVACTSASRLEQEHRMLLAGHSGHRERTGFL